MFTSRLAARGCAFLYPEKEIKYTEDYSKYYEIFNTYQHLDEEDLCQFVAREQGEVFSLLIEVVVDNKTINFFSSRPSNLQK